MKKNLENDDEKEDTTKYGEFITTYFAWTTLDKQKEKTKKMENITKRK